MANLIFALPNGDEFSAEVSEPRTIIGRGTDCDVVVQDVSVSRKHASFSQVDGTLVLEDLGSKNGTLIDGKPIRCETILGNCFVHFGDVRAQLVVGDGACETGVAAGETFAIRREDIARESVQLATFFDLAEMAADAQDPETLLEWVLKEIQEQIAGDSFFMSVFDPTGTHVAFEKQRGTKHWSPPQKIVSRVMSQRESVLFTPESEWFHSETGSSSFRSAVAVPLLVAGRSQGVIFVATSDWPHPYSRSDAAFLTTIGAFVVTLIRQQATVRALSAQSAKQRHHSPGVLIGDHPKLEAVRDSLEKFAVKGDAVVLIEGDSGTGKEIAARMIHDLSPRANGAFVAVNCASIPSELLESELFGHAKGAFTSAHRKRLGLFAQAANGTLFLDEIGEMTENLQSKLLRVLETREYRPVGADESMKTNARIVAATNQDLSQLVKQGRFRGDLFFRLNVLKVQMPPLREMLEIVPQLAEAFLKELKDNVASPALGVSVEAKECLVNHRWPGNVRELRNSIERAMYLCDAATIQPRHLTGLTSPAALGSDRGRLAQETEGLERQAIADALRRHDGNRTKVAADLGIARKTVIQKIKKYEIPG